MCINPITINNMFDENCDKNNLHLFTIETQTVIVNKYNSKLTVKLKIVFIFSLL